MFARGTRRQIVFCKCRQALLKIHRTNSSVGIIAQLVPPRSWYHRAVGIIVLQLVWRGVQKEKRRKRSLGDNRNQMNVLDLISLAHVENSI